MSFREGGCGVELRYEQIKNLEPPVGRSGRERCGPSVPEGDRGYRMRGRRGQLLDAISGSEREC